MIGTLVWLFGFGLEVMADRQKSQFKADPANKDKFINTGLWSWSRHPNYFAEWVVWTGLVIASFPSWVALYSQEHIVIWLLLLAGLLFTSRIMYFTLVFATGAVPSEHFSVQNRPGYKDYQQHTNRFFPGPRKPSSP